MSVGCVIRRRSWRSDMLSLALAALGPLSLAAIFPFDALRPVERHTADAVQPSFCAFADLSVQEERRVLSAARATWQASPAMQQGKAPDLFAEELPYEEPRPVIEEPAHGLRFAPNGEAYVPGSPPTDFRAPAPALLHGAPPMPTAPAFSRDELLKLN